MLQYLDYPPVWLLAALGLVWGETLLAPQLVPMAWAQMPGTALVGVAIVLFAAAAWEFWRARSTIIPHQTPQRLITGGVFALSRNPIYLADVVLKRGTTRESWGVKRNQTSRGPRGADTGFCHPVEKAGP
jgi:protein-S-isoprenylcysteine O-methyltransferase Ste14